MWRCMIILKSIQNPESGKYKDTYVAFVRYDMKIKDIYTEVPGLGTLYVKKDSQGNYQITQQVKKKEIREYINRIAEHEDVQALMNQTHESYQKAVGSDALLKEALDELKDAYENSIGNIRYHKRMNGGDTK